MLQIFEFKNFQILKKMALDKIGIAKRTVRTK